MKISQFGNWKLSLDPNRENLEHILDDLIKLSRKCGCKVEQLYCQHHLYQPIFCLKKASFDFGYGFRVDDDQYWLTVESTGEWTLTSRFDSDAETDEAVASGDVDNLNTEDNGLNQLTLIALGESRVPFAQWRTR